MHPIHPWLSCFQRRILSNVYSEEGPSHASEPGSRSSTCSSLEGAEDSFMSSVIHMALARLQLDIQQSEPAPASAFFRCIASKFTVPPADEYLRELHACWRDTMTLSRRPVLDLRGLCKFQKVFSRGVGIVHLCQLKGCLFSCSHCASSQAGLSPRVFTRFGR